VIGEAVQQKCNIKQLKAVTGASGNAKVCPEKHTLYHFVCQHDSDTIMLKAAKKAELHDVNSIICYEMAQSLHIEIFLHDLVTLQHKLVHN